MRWPLPIIWRLAGVRSEGVFSRAACIQLGNETEPRAKRSLVLRSVTRSTFRSSAGTQVAETCLITFSFQYQRVHVIRRLSVIIGETKTDADYITCT